MTFLAIFTVSVLATAILSGIIGMAGGIVLMGILVLLTSVSAAMVLHGAVQAASNGARCFFLRSHIQWSILPPYLVGAALALAAFLSVTLIPEPAYILITIGTFPWLARVTPMLRGLDVTRPATAVVCGVVVTAAQLFAGASGPLLDVFYVNSDLNRYQVIATKGLTQTIGHLLKLAYYGTLAGITLQWWPDDTGQTVTLAAISAGIAAAILGARIGTRLLGFVDEVQFRRVSNAIILALGAVCIASGVYQISS